MDLSPDVEAGQLVRTLRNASRASQRDLAVAAGVSKSLVAAIESGSRVAHWPVMLAIAEACGARFSVAMRNGTDLQLSELAWNARDRGGRRLPAHADIREADRFRGPCDMFRDMVSGRRKTHTFRHPKPHSRWPRWRDWRSRTHIRYGTPEG